MSYKLVLGFGIVITMLVSCNNSGETKSNKHVNLADSISYYEKVLFEGNANKIKLDDAKKLADFYETYATENKNDSLTPSYLFKAADINMNINRPENAIGCFNTILENHSDFANAPSALFLKAFIYEDQLQDYTNAEKYYSLFIEKYPNSDFADDAEISLKNLGKTPEELIKEFENRNK